MWTLRRVRVFLAYVGATLGHMGGPSWANRVAFLDTASGFVDTAPCSGVLGFRWGYMGAPGRAVVSQEGLLGTRFVDTAPCSGVLGLRWGCMGPHGRAVVGQEGCISRHRARFGGKFAVC